jgi:hypothetical protein
MGQVLFETLLPMERLIGQQCFAILPRERGEGVRTETGRLQRFVVRSKAIDIREISA